MNATTHAEMAEATVAVGELLHTIPADKVVTTPLGTSVYTANAITYSRWCHAIGVIAGTDDEDGCFGADHFRVAVGSLAGQRVDVYLMAVTQ